MKVPFPQVCQIQRKSNKITLAQGDGAPSSGTGKQCRERADLSWPWGMEGDYRVRMPAPTWPTRVSILDLVVRNTNQAHVDAQGLNGIENWATGLWRDQTLWGSAFSLMVSVSYARPCMSTYVHPLAKRRKLHSHTGWKASPIWFQWPDHLHWGQIFKTPEQCSWWPFYPDSVQSQNAQTSACSTCLANHSVIAEGEMTERTDLENRVTLGPTFRASYWKLSTALTEALLEKFK